MNTIPKPTLWIFTPSYGATSEVWMHRQLNFISKFDVRVFTWRLISNGFQMSETSKITLLPQPREHQKGRAYSLMRSLRNFRFNFYNGTLAEIKSIQQMIDMARPAVILCQYGHCGLHMLPLAQYFRIPLVVHFHGYDLSRNIRQPTYAQRLIWQRNRFAGLVVVATYMEDWLIRHGFRSDRIRKIPCGIPIENYLPLAEVGTKDCRFLSVGRLTPKKAPDLTIRAFAKCRQYADNVTLTIVGDGSLRTLCENLVDELGIRPYVSFLGAQSEQQVREELKKASVFVQHSITAKDGDKEGWPVALAEAAASGLPIVSTLHASIPEQVDHGGSGFLVKEGDWEDMSNAMVQLARDPQLRTRFGKAARRKIEAFDLNTQIGLLEDFLLEIATRY
jgi:colanic acid/amylovoran biosynthesis glycosyltransferase